MVCVTVIEVVAASDDFSCTRADVRARSDLRSSYSSYEDGPYATGKIGEGWKIWATPNHGLLAELQGVHDNGMMVDIKSSRKPAPHAPVKTRERNANIPDTKNRLKLARNNRPTVKNCIVTAEMDASDEIERLECL